MVPIRQPSGGPDVRRSRRDDAAWQLAGPSSRRVASLQAHCSTPSISWCPERSTEAERNRQEQRRLLPSSVARRGIPTVGLDDLLEPPRSPWTCTLMKPSASTGSIGPSGSTSSARVIGPTSRRSGHLRFGTGRAALADARNGSRGAVDAGSPRRVARSRRPVPVRTPLAGPVAIPEGLPD